MSAFATLGSPPCSTKNCWAARVSIWISTPFPTSGKTSWSSTTTCPNGVAARNRFWSFWLRTPLAKWSAIPAPTSYAAIRPMRYSVLSSFGRRVTAVCPPSWSSIPATTYANLSRLNQMGVTFMTLRRRSPGLVREIANLPRSAGRTVHLNVPHRIYQTPKIVDRRISLSQYQGQLRQLFIAELGHQLPTVLRTNDLHTSAAKRITRYAQRMLIENSLADSVDFFHLDALSSAVGLKMDFDVTLTEVSTGLYRLLGRRLRGYESAKSRQLFRHFLNTPAEVEIESNRIQVTLPKRAHNPLLIAAGFGDKATPIPWWDGRPLHIAFR